MERPYFSLTKKLLRQYIPVIVLVKYDPKGKDPDALIPTALGSIRTLVPRSAVLNEGKLHSTMAHLQLLLPIELLLLYQVRVQLISNLTSSHVG
jgi:hypothetical protein